GLDGREVMEIVCRDTKLNVSKAYLQPGFAFGGSCLPKDLRAILHRAKELDLEPSLMRSILPSNGHQIDEAYRLIKATGRKRVAVLGLSFKPGTDDLRESPMVELIEMLIGKGHQITIYDREVSLARLHGANKAYIEHAIPHISCLMRGSIEAALEGAQVIVVAKRSAEFAEAIATHRNGSHVVDLVGLPAQFREREAHAYEGICWKRRDTRRELLSGRYSRTQRSRHADRERFQGVGHRASRPRRATSRAGERRHGVPRAATDGVSEASRWGTIDSQIARQQ